MTNKITFTKKQKIIRCLIIAITCIIALSGLCFSLILNETRNIYEYILNNNSNIITYYTNLKHLYISEEIKHLLNEQDLALVISNSSYSVNISEGYTGFLTLPTVKVQSVKIYETNTTGVKVKFKDSTPFSGITIKKEALPDNLTNVEFIDVYANGGNNIKKVSTLNTKDSLSLDACNSFLVYIPATDILLDNTNTIYTNTGTSLNYTVVPEYATVSNLKYTNYDTKYITITENSELIGLQKGTTTVTCELDNVSKEITLNVLPTIEKITVNKNKTKICLNNWSYVIATYSPGDAVNTELVWSSSNESVAIVEDGMIKSRSIGRCTVTVSTKSAPYISATVEVEVVNASRDYRYTQGEYGYPDIIIEGPYYKDGILIVNKKYSIPSDFATGIDADALAALKEMQSAASSEGLSLPNISDFRSYTTQKYLYQRYISESGLYYANTYSARPGHSEHSTGLAFDIGNINYAYGLTASGKWLSENCYKFGFILRYQKGKEKITGYNYEPWHIRYVGKENAEKIYNSGLSLEEYLNLY